MASTADPAEKQPEVFAEVMRRRAEEALSSSVHHASLSQQYLTLAQKFSGLAEQSLHGSGGLQPLAAQLEREALTGIPATPAPFPQKACAFTVVRPTQYTSPLSSSVPSGDLTEHRCGAGLTRDSSSGQSGIAGSPIDRFEAGAHSATVAISIAPQQRIADCQQPLAANESDPLENSYPPLESRLPERNPVPGFPEQEAAPQAGESIAEVPRPSTAEPAPELSVEHEATSGATSETALEAAPAPVRNTGAGKKPRHRKSGKQFSVRRMLDRVRMAALEQAERVRIRARRSDLQPRIRKTSEEITAELKRSRMPATISMIITAVALLLLALSRLEFVENQEIPPLTASFSGSEEPVDESFVLEPPMDTPGEQQDLQSDELLKEPEPTPEPEPEILPEPQVLPEKPLELPPDLIPPEISDVQVTDAALPESPDGRIPTTPQEKTGNAGPKFDHRNAVGRQKLLQKYGGSVGSENAVSWALQWLAQRQRADGSWDFTDVGPCTSPGKIMNPIGGTAYALMPFLAAGHTHKEGPYRRQIEAGLRFLTQIGVVVPAGYDLRGVLNRQDDDEEPNYAYYVHGAATLALCEAYGMTKDRNLKAASEGAVQFLVNSQDPRGGGWRYNPGQPGSTSCTAIQVMALKAAEKAGIPIPEPTWRGVSFYLDSVSIDREGRYGYEIQKKAYEGSVTSMALLSRMYLGWGRDDGDLRAGVTLIDRKGPYDNLYYCYFATQVMRNWGGQEWQRWNERLRDDLVAWQERDGEAKGSWAPRDRSDYSVSGGRLLTTCLAALTLEVYYRYQPLLPEIEDVAGP